MTETVSRNDLIFNERRREVSHAYLWWFFLGAVGAHNFYLGRKGLGFAYLFTLGFVGVGVLVDLFILPRRTRKRNAEIAHDLGVVR